MSKCILGEFTLVLGECRKFVGKKITCLLVVGLRGTYTTPEKLCFNLDINMLYISLARNAFIKLKHIQTFDQGQ